MARVVGVADPWFGSILGFLLWRRSSHILWPSSQGRLKCKTSYTYASFLLDVASMYSRISSSSSASASSLKRSFSSIK